jgi:hypothetical protein
MIENTRMAQGVPTLDATTSGDEDDRRLIPITDEMIAAGIEALDEDLVLTSRALVSRVYRAMVLARESSKTQAIFR